MAGLFISRFRGIVRPEPEAAPSEEGWTIDRAEELLNSLIGVVSARVVARPGGSVEEIHLLTTRELTPKQIVRNVESALLAHFDLSVDHRVISVAQAEGDSGIAEGALTSPEPATHDERILFEGHKVVSERAHRIRVLVTVEWRGRKYTGEATGTDLPRGRLETTAAATIDSIERALAPQIEEDGVTLALDGVKMLEAFDRTFVLVAVHALHGRQITALAGAAPVEDNADRSVILGTLQATDRWVRGRV